MAARLASRPPRQLPRSSSDAPFPYQLRTMLAVRPSPEASRATRSSAYCGDGEGGVRGRKEEGNGQNLSESTPDLRSAVCSGGEGREGGREGGRDQRKGGRARWRKGGVRGCTRARIAFRPEGLREIGQVAGEGEEGREEAQVHASKEGGREHKCTRGRREGGREGRNTRSHACAHIPAHGHMHGHIHPLLGTHAAALLLTALCFLERTLLASRLSTSAIIWEMLPPGNLAPMVGEIWGPSPLAKPSRGGGGLLPDDVDDASSSPRVAGVRGNTGCGRRGSAPGGIAALLLPQCGCKPPEAIAPIIASDHYRRRWKN